MSKILIRDPFAEFDSLFAAGFPSAQRRRQRRATAAQHAATSSWQLPVNVYDTDDGVGIEAWLPGFKEEEIAVTVDDGLLRIHAEQSRGEESEGGGEDRKYRRREVTRTVLSRTFRLDPSYDASNISAHLANGVLELSLPKGEEPAPQQIAINSGPVSEAAAEVVADGGA